MLAIKNRQNPIFIFLSISSSYKNIVVILSKDMSYIVLTSSKLVLQLFLFLSMLMDKNKNAMPLYNYANRFL